MRLVEGTIMLINLLLLLLGQIVVLLYTWRAKIRHLWLVWRSWSGASQGFATASTALGADASTVNAVDNLACVTYAGIIRW